MPFGVVSGVDRGMGVLDGDARVPREGEVLGFPVPIGLDGVFLNRNIFDSSVKS